MRWLNAVLGFVYRVIQTRITPFRTLVAIYIIRLINFSPTISKTVQRNKVDEQTARSIMKFIDEKCFIF